MYFGRSLTKNRSHSSLASGFIRARPLSFQSAGSTQSFFFCCRWSKKAGVRSCRYWWYIYLSGFRADRAWWFRDIRQHRWWSLNKGFHAFLIHLIFKHQKLIYLVRIKLAFLPRRQLRCFHNCLHLLFHIAHCV